LATGQHHQLAIQDGDTVIISAHPIPGNEEGVHRTINRLFQRGAQVIYDPIEQVHVSGHASQEEQKLLINLVRPKYFIPIHGELRHLKQHARLAEQVGIPRQNIAVVENGTILTFDENSAMTIGERVPGGYVFVDGAGVGDVGPAVIRDRETLARDGVVIVNVKVSQATHECIGEPEIVSRGFVFLREAESLMENARQTVKRAISQNQAANGHKPEIVQDALSKMFFNETRRRPIVFAFVNEL
jgi:ribonuclease J